MPGFFITNTRCVPKLQNFKENNCLKKEIRYKEWKISINTLDKYMDDKIFDENEERIIVLDGVITNKKDLLLEFEENSWFDLINKLICSSDKWFERLRGVFAGAVYDKKKSKWTVFTDQCGAHLVLKYIKDGQVAFGTQLNYFIDWMKLNDIEKKLDRVWLNDFLYFGYMVDKHSVIENVMRLYPGTYLEYVDNIEKIDIYYRLEKKNIKDLTEKEAIELLDSTFSKAIKRIIDKDREYGYQTIVDISGGLDSRMNLCTALKFSKDLLTITYAETGSDDYKVSQKIRVKAGVENIFYSLDSGRCLKDIDELTFMNQGMNYYYGITGGKRVLQLIDSQEVGIEIWGLLGDISEGAMIQDGEEKEIWDYPRFRTISKYPYVDAPDREKFVDRETQWFYVRGMLAGMNTGFIRQNFVEPITPYGDVEFMNLCFSLPYAMRTKRHIYRRWMIEKYPEFANIELSATGFPLTKTEIGDYFSIPRRAYRKIFKIFNRHKPEWSMNPLYYWYDNNQIIKDYINKYFKDNIHILKEFPYVEKECNKLFLNNEKNTVEAMNCRIIALTIISVFKNYIK